MKPELLDTRDAERDRAVPVALYRAQSDPSPLVLFSPGYGGNRDGYAYLARQWAQNGLTVAVVEHVGSNGAALAELKRAHGQNFPAAVVREVQNPTETSHRVVDLQHVARLLDTGQPMGAGGHSYGSATAADLARRERLAGLLLLSPSGSNCADLDLPVLSVTGTRDASPDGQGYEFRLQAYRSMRPGRKYLAVLRDADHMAFAGVGLHLGRFLPLLQRITTRFWETTLMGEVDLQEEFLRLPSHVHWEAK
ncbi:MAG: hypothetical protein AB1758_15040 [Candidatus Eremiobacterota bacterium]